MKNINYSIGEKLKNLRREMGLSQMELSKILGIGQTTIAAYENGTHDPQLFSLIGYANVFDCSLDYLVGRENEEGLRNTILESNLNYEEIEFMKEFRKLPAGLKKVLQENLISLKNSEFNK